MRRSRSLVAAGAEHGLDEATVIQLLGALVDKSIVTVSFPSPDARYDLLDTVRDYALERLAEGGGLVRRAEGPRGVLRGAGRRAHVQSFVDRTGRPGVRRLELEHDNLWAALAYARAAPDPGIAIRLGALGWYFALAERVSDGRRFVELALASASEDAPVALRLELVAFLCYLATEELDLDAAIETGERALAATEPRPPQSALVEAALALALAESGDRRAGRRAGGEGARAPRSRPGTTGASRRSASCGPRSPLPPETCPQSPPWRRRRTVTPKRSGSTRFRSPRCCSRPGSPSGGARGAPRRRRISARSRSRVRAGFADHAAFALAGLGWNAYASGDLRKAEELERQALAAAEAARSPWTAAHARVRLARVLAAAGDADTAEALYRDVLEWSDKPRPHGARESLFLALAEDPGTAARAGLDDLGRPQRDPAAVSARAETALTS